MVRAMRTLRTAPHLGAVGCRSFRDSTASGLTITDDTVVGTLANDMGTSHALPQEG